MDGFDTQGCKKHKQSLDFSCRKKASLPPISGKDLGGKKIPKGWGEPCHHSTKENSKTGFVPAISFHSGVRRSIKGVWVEEEDLLFMY